ncbi:hypothetical protein HPP92_018971 [Vanilla planifolia]|uniref:Multiple C2 domain-containing protein n=1 Tax=Vanilla planifolia TaxID=51239 RepID=A0A835Q8M7_VANPL|nr:hypothetical protein HPP92_018971 [Vanilla planifolia]
MHYVRPLGAAQQDVLRHTAIRAVVARLARSEPPLVPEVVHYMLDTDAQMWSVRRSKANWFRLVGCLSRVATAARWVHRGCARGQTHNNGFSARAIGDDGGMAGAGTADNACLYVVGLDELDEELDGVPSGRTAEVVRARYERLRALAGRAQALLGDVAAQGERMEALVGWRDPRASGIFMACCLAAAVVLYAVPLRALLLGWGFFYLRHPRFRGDMPATAFNFFRRLPSMADRIL